MKAITTLLLCLLAFNVQAQTDSTRLSLHQRLEQRRNEAYAKIDSLQQKTRSRLLRNDKLRRADSLMNARDARARRNYDTLFIYKPPQHWVLKFRGNLSGNEVIVRGNYDDQDRRIELHAAHKLTFTAAVGYRGITLSVAANPLKWAGKNKDYELNLNSYSNRYGFDVIYTNAKTFRGSESVGGEKYDIETGKISQQLLTLDAYYAFNYRRFSYPAAFTQSQIQQRSAGSWLISAMFLGNRISAEESAEPYFPKSELHNYSFGLGGGYGYNLVLKHQWLIHASLTPEIVIFNRSNVKVNGEKTKMPYRFPNFMTVARGAVVHNWDRYFLATSIVFNYADMGDYDRLRLFQFKWRLRATFGLRL